MKALLLGFGEQGNQMEHRLQRLGCEMLYGMAPDSEVKMVFIKKVQSLGDVWPYVQSLRHVFIEQHSLSANDLQSLRKLANEAGVQVQFSSPCLYEWCIPDVMQQLHNVKFVQVYKDYDDGKSLIIGELRAELLVAAKVVGARIAKCEKVRSVVPCNFDVLGLRVDFVNAAMAYCWLSCETFSTRHELRLFGSNGMAVVDVLKREMRIKTADGAMFTTPFLSAETSEEKEVSDFVSNAQRNSPAFVSAAEVETLRIVEEKLGSE